MNILEQAITLEVEGEAFYKEQAAKSEDNLKKVFLMLAEDENMHAKILQNKKENISYELKENGTLQYIAQIFSDHKKYSINYKEKLDQLDVYRMALVKEKESIDLYNAFKDKAVSENEISLYEYLIEQERNHFRIIEDLIILVNRPNDWVESAEFGNREEY